MQFQGPGGPALNPSLRSGVARRSVLLPLALLFATGSAMLLVHTLSAEPEPQVQAGPSLSPSSSPQLSTPPAAPKNYKPAEIFVHWPKQKPDLVLVISGQTHGYLQKCGCSDPQKGGLERRYNFIESLRAKGWEVVPVDNGDVAHMTKIPNQALLKYRVAMESMKEIGYRAVGVGKEEFRFTLLSALSAYSLNNDEPPIVATNFEKPEQQFPGEKRSMVRLSNVTPTKSGILVGTVGVIGKSLRDKADKIDPALQFAANGGELVAAALKEFDAAAQKQNASHTIPVLLYQGWSERDPVAQIPAPMFDEAKNAAQLMPAFRVVVCPSEESEPPAKPTMVGKTMIVQVGHKGQNVGVVGIFKNEKGELDLHYERVPIGPEFDTPEDKEANHPILKKLEEYARQVKASNFLGDSPKMQHPAQGKVAAMIKQGALPANSKMEFVGSEKCLGCHAAEYAVWMNSKHAKGYAALEKIARKPGLRNFDPECIVCHTVGFEFQTGFVDALKTPNLKNIGCENCHGPGSLHVAQPRNKTWLAEMSPWKGGNPAAMLPDVATMKKLIEAKSPDERAKLVTVAQERVMLKVHDMCFKCHDTDNDPHYQLEKYWPQIHHPTAK